MCIAIHRRRHRTCDWIMCLWRPPRKLAPSRQGKRPPWPPHARWTYTNASGYLRDTSVRGASPTLASNYGCIFWCGWDAQWRFNGCRLVLAIFLPLAYLLVLVRPLCFLEIGNTRPLPAALMLSLDFLKDARGSAPLRATRWIRSTILL